MRRVRLGFWFVESATRDIEYALRSFGRNPGLALVAILTLAVGVGANTAVFALVNAVLLRPLSYPDPSRMVFFMTTSPEGVYANASEAKFNAWRSIPSTFASVAAFRFPDMILAAGDRFESVFAGEVTPEFFRLFGASTQVGRTFTDAEGRPGAPHVVVISDRLWTRHFQRGNAIGQALQLDGRSYVVVGILQPGFDTATLTSAEFAGPDLWVPLQIDPTGTSLDAQLLVAGRVLPSVSLAEAQSRVAAAAVDLHRRFPAYVRSGDGATVEPLQKFLARHDRSLLLVLLGAVCLVLLIACANISNLLLARGVARTPEVALRAALGATRGRIVQQLITESVVLAAIGSVAGSVFGRLAINAVVGWTGPTITRIGLTGHGVPMDTTVLGFTCAIATMAVLAFGLAPALLSSRVDLSRRLNNFETRGSSRHRNRIARLLTAGEIGVAVVLLVGAALFTRTFANLGYVRPGFETHHLLALQSTFPAMVDSQSFDPSARARSIRDAQERLRAIPGVIDATASCCVPFVNGDATLRYIVEGRPLTGLYHGMGGWRPISSHYFETLRIPVVTGRAFTDRDSLTAPGVVIINQAMAYKWWPNGGGIGHRIILGRGIGGVWNEPPREIVGIVANVRDSALDREAQPVNYVPIDQLRMPLQLGWLVRTQGDPEALRSRIEQALQHAGGGMPITTVGEMDTLIHHTTTQAAFRMWLMSAFAVIAVLLAAIGVYGQMAYAVRRRTREIGIRVAVGAEPSAVTRMIVMASVRDSIIGIVGGVATAVVAVRVVKSFLFGLSPWDPGVFAIAVIVLLLVATVAAWIPARHAAGIDPLTALRGD
ncbi:MAG TPA: ABC transporter permease [Vicinamibacterales bacterium]